jgi:hypothetical protein
LSFKANPRNLIGKNSRIAIEAEIRKICTIEISPPQKSVKAGSSGKINPVVKTQNRKHPTPPSTVLFPTLIRPKAFPTMAATASPRIKRVKQRKQETAATSL